MDTKLQPEINLIELFWILAIIVISYWFIFFFKETPCPLCLTQRWGLIGVAFGFLLNMKYGPRPIHYLIAFFSALLTATVAVRQIFLHIVPGTGAYGIPLYGWHIYTWLFLIAVLIIVSIVLLLIYNRPFRLTQVNSNRWLRWLINILFIIVIIGSLSNLIFAATHCGFLGC
jgi:disulfide bond formation protein DsbB